ncbi:MAG: alpha/beta hydrolase [Cellulomonas sp. 73-145]|uniref:alpha/beta hydrolase n=1 Tax=Cellulomonas sp. 73-145 TaxID=1895739 RepID=UPI000925DE99|nr:alpha/beta hydrolase [Cellulomonas sp. 73-145]MBN9328527.1 alpha/beta hydrolase [Cellulomonas sp.]OJV60115.1 MAG: alpha/beta hydrolase [Cellulomonas sp. 73-145]
MHLHTSSSADGVDEHDFMLDDVPGVLWTPSGAVDPPPALVLMGHGGGLHKRAPGLVARARHLVATYGYAVAAVDAPGHGDRPRSAVDQRLIDAMVAARAAGQPLAPFVVELNASIAERAVPEWRATIDALQALPQVGAEAPIGYTGLTLATGIGIPLILADARIRAAVLGGYFGTEPVLALARQVTIPVEVILSWDDPELDRPSGLALFDAFGSPHKTLRAHVGGHHQVPWVEVEQSERFLEWYLTGSGT